MSPCPWYLMTFLSVEEDRGNPSELTFGNIWLFSVFFNQAYAIKLGRWFLRQTQIYSSKADLKILVVMTTTPFSGFGHITGFIWCAKRKTNKYQWNKIWACKRFVAAFVSRAPFPLFWKSPSSKHSQFKSSSHTIMIHRGQVWNEFLFLTEHFLTDSSTNEKSFTVNREASCFLAEMLPVCEESVCLCVCVSVCSNGFKSGFNVRSEAVRP